MGDQNGRPIVVGLACLLAVAFVVAGQARAQGNPPTLTLDEAVERALANHPTLRAARLAVEAERHGRDGAALPTPFGIEAELEGFAGSGALEAFDATETTLALSKVIERGDKRLLRTALASAAVASAETESMLLRLDLAAEVTRRFIEVVVDAQQLAIAQDAVALSEQTLALVARRVEIGRASEAELASAEIGVAEAELERAARERQLEADRFRLASLWADPGMQFVPADVRLFELPELEPFAAIEQGIERSPDLLRLFDELDVLEAEQRLAAARRRSDLSLGFGIKHAAEPGDAGLVFSVAVPLGSRSRAAPRAAEAAARAARIPALIERRRLELGAILYGFYQELELARDRLAALRADLLPAGERAVTLYREGFELGSYSLLELTEAERKLLELRRQALAAAANYHLTLVDLEQLLGGLDRTGEIR